jgi:hypothetical protein
MTHFQGLNFTLSTAIRDFSRKPSQALFILAQKNCFSSKFYTINALPWTIAAQHQ